MASHRFSMLAKVGLLMAWAWRFCCVAPCVASFRRERGVRAAAQVLRVVVDPSCRRSGDVRSIAPVEKGCEG
jgi:hypothetical protein